MNDAVLAELLRATKDIRSGDPSSATAIIQAALAAGGLATPARDPNPARLPSVPSNLWTDDPAETRSHEPSLSNTFAPKRRLPLGEVLRVLAAGRGRLGLVEGTPGLGGSAAARASLPRLPEGAEFRNLTFSCAAGTRGYRLYIPADAANGIRGMILMLHGCTQSPEDFAAGTRMNAQAEAFGLLVVYPAQTGGDNSMSCWNWFRPGDQRRGKGEPAILAGLTESLREEFAVPRDRIFVAGLSAGGAMAAILGETYPDIFAAVGVHSGLAYGSASDVVSAFSAMRGRAPGASARQRATAAELRPRVIVFQGTADTTVHPTNAERVIADNGGVLETMARSDHPPSNGCRGYTRRVDRHPDGTIRLELWTVDGAQHAWSGGHTDGSYTDPRGPDASSEMARFFLEDEATSTV